jgi:replicative DNA helicase
MGDIVDPFNQATNRISTGFSKLDEMTGRLHSGELVILAARTSMARPPSP